MVSDLTDIPVRGATHPATGFGRLFGYHVVQGALGIYV
jgi:hypothetical protein